MRHSRAWSDRRYSLMRALPLITLTLLPSGCREGTAPELNEPVPFVIIPAAAAAGVPDAYFTLLPPLVEHTAPQGEFHPGLAPRIDVCLLDGTGATRQCVSGPPALHFAAAQIAVTDGHYQVDWKTSSVESREAYRITVGLGGRDLGSIDVVFGSNGPEARDLAGDGLVGVVAGQAIPIKFRIARGVLCQGAPGCVETAIGAEGGSITDGEGVAGVVLPQGWVAPDLGKVNVYIVLRSVDSGTCLPTPLPQLQACMGVHTEPELGAFLAPVEVGLCVDATDRRARFSQLASYDAARGFELLQPAAGPALSCGPSRVRLSGLMRHFSDVGAVELVHLETIRGDGQSGAIGSELPVRATVRAVVQGSDASGNPVSEPVPGIALTFAATAPDGSIQEQTAETDASGEGSVAWRLGATAGQNTMRVYGAALDTLSLTATGIVAYRLSGTLRYGTTPAAGSRLELFVDTMAAPVAVAVTDAAGIFAFDPVPAGTYWKRWGGYDGFVRFTPTVVMDRDRVEDLYLARSIELLEPASGATLSPAFPRFSWTEVPLAESYLLQIIDAATGRSAAAYTTTSTSFEQGLGLVPGRSYVWRVQALDAQPRYVGYAAATRQFTLSPDLTLFGHVGYSSSSLQGITIELRQGTTTAPVLATVVSGADGRYAFGPLAPAMYWLHPLAGPEYTTTSFGMNLSTTSRLFDFSLRKPFAALEPLPNAVIESLHPTLRWQPLPEAVRHRVTVYQNSPWMAVDTATVLGDTYTVRTALSEGFRYSWNVDALDASRYIGQLSSSFSIAGGSFVVQGTVYVSGTALDGAPVLLRKDTDSGPIVQSLTTAGGGKYQFAGVPGGRYVVVSELPTGAKSGQTLDLVSPVTVDLWLAGPLTELLPAAGRAVSGQPTLSWAAFPGAAQYFVDVYETNGWVQVESRTITTNTYTIQAPLKPGTQYTWDVWAYDVAGHALVAGHAWFVTAGGTERLSGTFFYGGVPRDGVVLELHEGTVDGPLAQSLTTADGGRYSFPAVPLGRYIFRYSGVAIGDGYRGMDLFASDTTFDFYVSKPTPVIEPAYGAIVSGQPTLRWQGVPAVASYQIYVREAADGTLVESQTLYDTSYRIQTVLKPGTEYSWFVGGYDLAGHPIASVYSRFTTSAP